MLVCLCYL